MVPRGELVEELRLGPLPSFSMFVRAEYVSA